MWRRWHTTQTTAEQGDNDDSETSSETISETVSNSSADGSDNKTDWMNYDRKRHYSNHMWLGLPRVLASTRFQKLLE